LIWPFWSAAHAHRLEVESPWKLRGACSCTATSWVPSERYQIGGRAAVRYAVGAESPLLGSAANGKMPVSSHVVWSREQQRWKPSERARRPARARREADPDGCFLFFFPPPRIRQAGQGGRFGGQVDLGRSAGFLPPAADAQESKQKGAKSYLDKAKIYVRGKQENLPSWFLFPIYPLSLGAGD